MCNIYEIKVIKSDVEKITAKSITNNLERIFEEKFSDTFDQIKNNQVSISGSFILQCFYGEDYDSDIDIYLFIKSYKTGAHTYGTTDIENYVYDNFKTNGGDGENLRYIFKGPCIISRKYVVLQFCNLDFIHVHAYDYQDTYRFIQNKFDFDICKNIYYHDGKSGKMVVKLYSSIFDLEKKIIRFNKMNCDNFTSTLERCKKYIVRGFSIIQSTKITQSEIAE